MFDFPNKHLPIVLFIKYKNFQCNFSIFIQEFINSIVNVFLINDCYYNEFGMIYQQKKYFSIFIYIKVPSLLLTKVYFFVSVSVCSVVSVSEFSSVFFAFSSCFLPNSSLTFLITSSFFLTFAAFFNPSITDSYF